MIPTLRSPPAREDETDHETTPQNNPGEYYVSVVRDQVRQTPSGADIQVVTSGPIEAEHLVKLVEAELAHASIPRPVVRVEVVESIARQGDAEKLPRMVPLPS